MAHWLCSPQVLESWAAGKPRVAGQFLLDRLIVAGQILLDRLVVAGQILLDRLVVAGQFLLDRLIVAGQILLDRLVVAGQILLDRLVVAGQICSLVDRSTTLTVIGTPDCRICSAHYTVVRRIFPHMSVHWWTDPQFLLPLTVTQVMTEPR